MSRSTMRWTLALAAILAAVGIRAISLGANGGSGAGGKGPAVGVAASSSSAVERALEKQVSVKLKDTTLKEMVAYLTDLSGVNVLLDSKTLADAGFSDATPINFEISGVSLHAAIRELCARKELGYAIPEDNVILITTAAAAREHIVTRIYNVEDLLPPAGPVNEFTEFQLRGDASSLGNLLTENIQPASWVNSGGNIGSISILGSCLVVNHNLEAHREIAELLAALRKVKSDEKAGTAPPLILVDSTPAEEKIRRRLERRQDVDFHQTPLSGVIEFLRAQDIPTIALLPQLNDNGIVLETPMSFAAKQVPLKYALRTMLGHYEVNFILRDEMLEITTDSEAKSHVRLGVYPVADLLDAKAGDREGDLDFESLADLIVSTVAPTSWTDVGGPAPISHYANPVVLVIAQTDEIHEQIADLLQRLRAARRAPHESAAAKAPAAANDAMVVRVHLVLNKDNAAMDQYIAIIRNLIEPKSWSEGSGYLGKVPGAIVVRNTAAAQERIRNLLDQLDSATTVGGFGKPAPPGTPALPTTTVPAASPPPIVDPAAPKAAAPSEPKSAAAPKPK